MVGHDDKTGELKAAAFPSGVNAAAQEVALGATEQRKPTAEIGGDEENFATMNKTT